ncbi:DnaB-like helicase C-terminal domain-containing protein [Borreliella tanukii]|uniref:DnaB-like helicase C-terminal domain-containing protein n=1 Tax=Borreliella tanukii TaxID=56146 RepID=UPI003CC91157
MRLLSTIKQFPSSIISLFTLKSARGIQIHELKAQARQMKRNYGVEIIFIDYISQIPMSQNNIPCFEQVAFLGRNISELVYELEIPIIVLSQVARSAEGEGT